MSPSGSPTIVLAPEPQGPDDPLVFDHVPYIYLHGELESRVGFDLVRAEGGFDAPAAWLGERSSLEADVILQRFDGSTETVRLCAWRTRDRILGLVVDPADEQALAVARSQMSNRASSI